MAPIAMGSCWGLGTWGYPTQQATIHPMTRKNRRLLQGQPGTGMKMQDSITVSRTSARMFSVRVNCKAVLTEPQSPISQSAFDKSSDMSVPERL